jgi:hypothetical protein
VIFTLQRYAFVLNTQKHLSKKYTRLGIFLFVAAKMGWRKKEFVHFSLRKGGALSVSLESH